MGAVLEAVYAVEKLPDAALRDRLSKHLDLSTRQIQVWFQNRRQRAKTGGSTTPSTKKSNLNTPNEVMNALFEFSGNLNGDASANLMAAAQAQGAGGGAASASAAAQPAGRSGSSSGSRATASPPSTGAFDCESFERDARANGSFDQPDQFVALHAVKQHLAILLPLCLCGFRFHG